MTIHLSKAGDRVFLEFRASGGDALGDARFEVKPGDLMFGHTYAEWLLLPDGPYEVRN